MTLPRQPHPADRPGLLMAVLGCAILAGFLWQTRNDVGDLRDLAALAALGALGSSVVLFGAWAIAWVLREHSLWLEDRQNPPPDPNPQP